jgi:hypothetical protein
MTSDLNCHVDQLNSNQDEGWGAYSPICQKEQGNNNE